MTVEELIEVLGERRVHTSSKNPLELRFPYHTKDYEERKMMIGKPAGLWWGVGGSWIEWCASEMPDWLQPYLYEVSPPERLLRITTMEEYLAFNERYVPKGHMLRWHRMPEWGEVAVNYDAIEIAPYRYERRLEDVWYYGWDCASGCAWKGATVKLIGVRKGDGYELAEGVE